MSNCNIKYVNEKEYLIRIVFQLTDVNKISQQNQM